MPCVTDCVIFYSTIFCFIRDPRIIILSQQLVRIWFKLLLSRKEGKNGDGSKRDGKQVATRVNKVGNKATKAKSKGKYYPLWQSRALIKKLLKVFGCQMPM